MAKIVVTESVTLDGVVQGLGRADEDPRDGFDLGGWGRKYQDPVMMEVMGKGMAEVGALLFGRRTYEDFFHAWAGRTDGNPFTDVLDNTPKYVASTTLAEPLVWKNSTLLGADLPAAVAELKAAVGGSVVVLGSGALVRSLAEHGLVDEYVLSVHPLVLGKGRRLFPAEGPGAELRLVDSVPTTTGVVIATYEVER
jgi:dihydrofolate reductase